MGLVVATPLFRLVRPEAFADVAQMVCSRAGGLEPIPEMEDMKCLNHVGALRVRFGQVESLDRRPYR